MQIWTGLSVAFFFLAEADKQVHLFRWSTPFGYLQRQSLRELLSFWRDKVSSSVDAVVVGIGGGGGVGMPLGWLNLLPANLLTLHTQAND